MNANAVSIKNGRPWGMFLLAGLAAVSLLIVWQGVGKMMTMKTQATNHTEFAQLRAQDDAKIVVEVAEVRAGRIGGKLLDKRDETHYTRTGSQAEVVWGKDTSIVMGKAEDLRAGAVVHVTGKVAADHSVQAQQIVILTGYLQVK